MKVLCGALILVLAWAQAGISAPQADPQAVLEKRLRELEQRNRELEAAAAAAAAAPARPTPVAATATPAAAPPAARPQAEAEASEHLPFSGYMEWHLNKESGESARPDFHRFVLLFGHSFSSRIKFWSELELEHAFVEGGEEKGELELEQAYLDFYLKPYLNLRGGMILAPMGEIGRAHV